jgi:hypothetical protein
MVGTVPEVKDGAQASDSDAADIEPSLRRPVVRGPALIVLGIALLIVVVGLVGAAVSSGKAPVTSVHQVTLADGTTVSLTPATTALHSLVGEGDPPADILGNLAVPSGSRVTQTINADQSAGQFDRTVAFTTAQAGDQVVDTYKALLPKQGWDVLYAGAGIRNGRSGTEVLAKRGSSDGYQWEVGIVVSPATATGTTPFSVEVFELSDVT